MEGLPDWIDEARGPAGLLLLAAVAALEALFPPFPGDVAVLACAFFVATRGWSLAPMLAASTVGSLGGAMVHYAVGRWLGARRWEPKSPRGQRALRAILDIVVAFERHGAVYLALNRFVPGVRSFFFLAAGWARIPVAAAIGWGVVSALAWNLLLVGAAFLVEDNWDRLSGLMKGYSLAAWGLVVVVGIVFFLRRRKKP